LILRIDEWRKNDAGLFIVESRIGSRMTSAESYSTGRRVGEGVALPGSYLGKLFYCSGDAGKISDLITTGTAPEDGIKEY
jgi:hypothetical protein